MHPASLRNYVAILRNGRFVLLCVCGGFNFRAIFLYISSAAGLRAGYPQAQRAAVRLVLRADHCRHRVRSFLNGRLAGRFSGRRTVNLGFLLCGIARDRQSAL